MTFRVSFGFGEEVMQQCQIPSESAKVIGTQLLIIQGRRMEGYFMTCNRLSGWAVPLDGDFVSAVVPTHIRCPYWIERIMCKGTSNLIEDYARRASGSGIHRIDRSVEDFQSFACRNSSVTERHKDQVVSVGLELWRQKASLEIDTTSALVKPDVRPK